MQSQAAENYASQQAKTCKSLTAKEKTMASSNVRSKRSEVAEQASTIAKDLQEVGAGARRMAGESMETLREYANEYLDEGRAKAREFGDTVTTRIKEQPMQSILVATAVGFLLGVLWIRR
jgi:ElaB/YqjD/DUF883 family membrane-anchored ribosome-binding protein